MQDLANYYGYLGSSRDFKTNELMIANIIGVLNNLLVSKLLSQDEFAVLGQAVKNYV